MMLAVALDEPARLDRRRVAHLSERAAASAAAVGNRAGEDVRDAGADPRSRTVPSCVESSCAVDAVERHRRQRVEAAARLLRARGVRVRARRRRSRRGPGRRRRSTGLRPRADEPDVLARQADERVGRDDAERRRGLTAASPVTGGVELAVLAGAAAPATRDRRSSRRRAARPATSESGTAPKEMFVASSASTGDDEPCRVDRDLQRHAAQRVPRELGGAEQAAVVRSARR